jgi:hypothetical protein
MGQFSTKYEVIASRSQGHRHFTAKQNKREYISMLRDKSAVLCLLARSHTHLFAAGLEECNWVVPIACCRSKVGNKMEDLGG